LKAFGFEPKRIAGCNLNRPVSASRARSSTQSSYVDGMGLEPGRRCSRGGLQEERDHIVHEGHAARRARSWAATIKARVRSACGSPSTTVSPELAFAFPKPRA
jgi:hypothetical protein